MKIKLALFIIITLFLATRLYKITEIPASVYWDEASIGYNAYSVLQTGKDEWGEVFPAHFRAFGEYKLPIYIYVTAIFESFLGLNILAVRLPAVMFTLGSVIALYLLSLRLTRSPGISLLSAFIFSISPWNFLFSRTGYEATAGLMFYLLGIYLYLIEKNRKFALFMSVISFIFSLYSYNSFRIITPLTLFILFIYEMDIKTISSNLVKKVIEKFPYILLFLIGLIPIVRLYMYGDGLNRLNTVGIFNEGLNIKTLPTFIFNYLQHFNPIFLFIEGDANLRSQIPGFGQLLFIDLPFVILGLFFIFKFRQKATLLVLSLILISPLAASITKESPHALRAISMSPFLAITSSLGINYLLNRIDKHKKLFMGVIVSLYVIFFSIFYLTFIYRYNIYASMDWQYPYKVLFENYGKNISQAKHAYISDTFAQPYIFYLFYNNYTPAEFLKENERNTPDKWGFSSVRRIGKVEFVDFNIKKEFLDSSFLVVPSNIQNIEGEKMGEIKLLNGEKVLDVYSYE